MTRAEFERLRDMPDKTIVADIRLQEQRQTKPLLRAEDIRIANGANADLRLTLTYNPLTGSKSINVLLPGLGAVCRLDVDGPEHPPAGRSHKHSLRSEECPRRNLPSAVAWDGPSGATMREVFDDFCCRANITHQGEFHCPER